MKPEKVNFMKKELLDDELKERSPLLLDAKKQGDGFRLPEGYFEALEDAVFSRVDSAGIRRKPVLEAKRGGLFGRFSRSGIAWAAAATFVIVLAAAWFFKTQFVQPLAPVATTQQELTEEEIETYVIENIQDFDASLIAAVPVGEHVPPETKSATPTENNPAASDPLDDLSDEELELLLKEMSDAELENLLKT
ncbi:MAG: hypothetical protein OHK0019_28630 [Saprospiraceae bacterium]